MDEGKSLTLSYFDAFFFSIMVGAGESYLPAFALSSGMSETLAGFFSSLPLIAGATVQLISPWGIMRVGSIKKWVVGAATLQGLAFLPLIWFSVQGTTQHWILFLIVTFYWGAGFAAGPPWNYWMTHLVPDHVSTHFFSRRTRIIQFGTLVGLIAGGVALQQKISFGPLTSVFSILFLGAFISRFFSSWMLSAKSYKNKWFVPAEQISLTKSLRGFWLSPSYRKFFGFLFFFYAAIMISSPFVSPYMLAKLHLSYFEFMVALASLFAAKIMASTIAPTLIRKWGVRTVFLIGAIGIAPLPAFWSLGSGMIFVAILQAISGAFWGFFEVTITMIFFQQLKNQEKISVLSLYNFFNAAATILGTLIGGQILHAGHESMGSYQFIYVAGSALRLVLVLGFVRISRHEKFLTAEVDSQTGF